MKKDSSQVNRIKKEAWQSMEQMLNDEMPIDKKKERKYGIWFMYSVAASLMLIFTATYVSYHLMGEASKKTSYVFSQNKKIEAITDAQYGGDLFSDEKNHHPEVIYSNLPTKNRISKQLLPQSKSVNQVSILNDKRQNSPKIEVNSILESRQNNAFKKNRVESGFLLRNSKKIESVSKSVNQSTLKSVDSKADAQSSIQDDDILTNKKEMSNTILKNKMVTNDTKRKIQIVSPIDFRKAIVKDKVDFGLKTNGSVGFVSKGFDNYGIRFGLEFSKNLNSTLALNSGVRYSAYKESYNTTYRLGEEEIHTNYKLITDLSNRKVDRRFLEFPLYADYSLTEVIKFKAGALVTYNKNNSSNANYSALTIANNNYINDDVKLQAGKLMQDKHGYLGEAVVGATINLDKISLDVEGNYGLISNQTIDNRSILGVRLNYKFGR